MNSYEPVCIIINIFSNCRSWHIRLKGSKIGIVNLNHSISMFFIFLNPSDKHRIIILNFLKILLEDPKFYLCFLECWNLIKIKPISIRFEWWRNILLINSLWMALFLSLMNRAFQKIQVIFLFKKILRLIVILGCYFIMGRGGWYTLVVVWLCWACGTWLFEVVWFCTLFNSSTPSMIE